MGRGKPVDDARRLQLDAARAFIASPLRGSGQPSNQQFRIMGSTALRDLEGLSYGDCRLLQTGVLKVCVHTGALDAGLELAETLDDAGMQPEDLTLDPELSLGFTAAMTELYIAAGQSSKSLEYSGRLLKLLHDDTDPLWREYVYGIVAATYVFSGQFESADDVIARMDSLACEQGWDRERLSYFQAVAQAVIGFSRMDRPYVERLRPRMQALVDAEPIAASLAQTVEALGLMFEGETAAALALAQHVAQGILQPDGPALVRQFALGLAAVLLVVRGTPQQALSLLEDAETPHQHFICFGYIRSSALIQLGDYRGALLATDECMRMRSSHISWSMPAVLLRRAVANHQMGHITAAMHDASDAIHLADLSYPAAGVFLLPPDKVKALGALLLLRSPRIAPKLNRVRSALSSVLPTTPPAFSQATLSKREQLVATHLRGRKNYAEIAAELHVSPGTIKAQSFSIQKKVGLLHG